MMSKSPLLIDLKFSDRAGVEAGLKRHFPDREIIDLASEGDGGRDLSACRYAALWKPDANLFRRAPNLQVLFSGGAGVDAVLTLAGVPDVPLVRFVDPSLTQRMGEYVVLQCLHHLRRAAAYRASQQARKWQPLPQPAAGAVTVGVMGLGELGLSAAAKLKAMGFDVIGWSRGKKAIDGIETFDAAGRDAFLARADILVNLLPLTEETAGLCDLALFERLKRGGPLGAPVFINAGRGGSQVEADIVAALDRGILGGASLDVFETEPLPDQSPLWSRDNVVITPHVAADTDVDALFAHIRRQIERFETGLPLEHVVGRDRGY